MTEKIRLVLIRDNYGRVSTIMSKEKIEIELFDEKEQRSNSKKKPTNNQSWHHYASRTYYRKCDEENKRDRIKFKKWNETYYNDYLLKGEEKSDRVEATRNKLSRKYYNKEKRRNHSLASVLTANDVLIKGVRKIKNLAETSDGYFISKYVFLTGGGVRNSDTYIAIIKTRYPDRAFGDHYEYRLCRRNNGVEVQSKSKPGQGYSYRRRSRFSTDNDLHILKLVRATEEDIVEHLL